MITVAQARNLNVGDKVYRAVGFDEKGEPVSFDVYTVHMTYYNFVDFDSGHRWSERFRFMFSDFPLDGWHVAKPDTEYPAAEPEKGYEEGYAKGRKEALEHLRRNIGRPRYTIVMQVAELNEHGETIETLGVHGPTLATNDLEGIKSFLATIEEEVGERFRNEVEGDITYLSLFEEE